MRPRASTASARSCAAAVAGATRALTDLASDASRPLHGRVAALFTLKQVDGNESHGALRKLAGDEAVREFALRALADRKTELDGVEATPFRAALADPSPRVRAQAVIAWGDWETSRRPRASSR